NADLWHCRSDRSKTASEKKILAKNAPAILKPSEVSPLSSILFAEILHEAGTPPGVFNLVNGDGPGVGTQLSGHRDVQMISFTGSTRAGIAISKNAADTLKRVTLELGGKGANIIFDDADDQAVERGVLHCFNNAGQSCSAPTRMLVQRSRYDQAVDQAVRTADAMTYGQSGDVDWNMGPVVNATQFGKIQDLIEAGIAGGARLAAGGPGRPEGFNRGYYCRATVFADVDNDMRIAREEIFGPVLSILPFDTEEEAIAIANDTDYGLSNYVQSQDGEKRNRVATQLRSGTVEMNGVGRGAGCPFGGMKASGVGREGGAWGLEDFMEIKAVSGWA
ncbi:MAG: aldehyde dehydrogenase family protein, partial [Pseudomonadota bacterium]